MPRVYRDAPRAAALGLAALLGLAGAAGAAAARSASSDGCVLQLSLRDSRCRGGARRRGGRLQASRTSALPAGSPIPASRGG